MSKFILSENYKKTFRRSIHTAQVFHLQKSTFINRTSSFPESFLSQTVIGQSETRDVIDRPEYDNWQWGLVWKSRFTTHIIIAAVKLNLQSQYSNAHEATELLTCKVCCSAYRCVMWQFLK